MKVRKVYFSLISLFFYFLVNSQVNLVSNSSFENHTSCPTFMLQWDKCIGWTNCNGNVGSGLWGTPDYYHTCGLVQSPYNPVPPNTGMGYCNPHSGDAMMGLVCYNAGYVDAREYITTQLTCPLTIGNTYTVSFWISTQSSPQVKYNSSHFGAYLSNSAVTQSGFNLVSVTPQYEITSLITNTNWQQHTFTISPTTNLNYITLGCFKSDAVITKSLTTPSAWQPYSNYFIDDIEILSSASSSSFSISPSSTNVTCNGSANGSATVTATGIGPYSYFWTPGSYTTASVSNLSTGVYTVTVNGTSCSFSTSTISITQSPVLTSSIMVSSFTNCDNDSLILNSSISGGTPPYTITWNNGAVNTNSITVNSQTMSVYSCTVTDSNNCINTQTIQLSLFQSVSVHSNTPNVFTPNGDGVNDIFDFKALSNCENFTFEIFDRWGLSIFKMNDKKQSFWDGRTTSGEEVTDGTYFYIMNIESGSKSKGMISVFR